MTSTNSTAPSSQHAGTQTLAILSALVIGVVVGEWMYRSNGALAVDSNWMLAGNLLLLRPLQMILIPLVVVAVIHGISSIGDPKRLGMLGLLVAAFYLGCMLCAATLGTILVETIRPGSGLSPEESARLLALGETAYRSDATRLATLTANEATGIGGAWSGILQQLLPKSPIGEAAAGNTIGVIVFSIMLGLGLAAGGERTRIAREVIDGLFHALLAVIQWILWLMPIGLFCFLVGIIGRVGLSSVGGAVGAYMLVVLLGLFIHGFIILPLLACVFARCNGWMFMWSVRRALFTGFATSSSNATLPVTVRECTGPGGCSPRATNFVIPLGATLNLDGTALYEAVAALFLFQLCGVELTTTDLIIAVLTATLAAIGAAGIPSAGLVTLVIVVAAVNTSLAGRGVDRIPVSAIGLIIGVDRLLDMARTTINVWGDCVGAKIVTRLLPEAD